jgi:hypothetical protein
MRTSFTLASCLFLVASLAHAEQPAFQGKWTGSATNSTGNQVQVALTVTKTGGVLRMAQNAGYVTRDECLDRDVPYTVSSQTDSELNLTAKTDKVLKGCFDEAIKLTLVDPKTVQASLKDGRSMKLTHK